MTLLLEVWQLSELNTLQLCVTKISLPYPTPRKIDTRQVCAFKLRRIKLAARKIGARDLDTTKVGAIEVCTGSDQDCDGVGGGKGGIGISLGLVDDRAKLLFKIRM
jgi:hypothetical protein